MCFSYETGVLFLKYVISLSSTGFAQNLQTRWQLRGSLPSCPLQYPPLVLCYLIVLTLHYVTGVLSLNFQFDRTEADQLSYPRATDERTGECRIQFIVCNVVALNQNLLLCVPYPEPLLSKTNYWGKS